MAETVAEEAARIRREIAVLQLRLQRLVAGDPGKGLTLTASSPTGTFEVVRFL